MTFPPPYLWGGAAALALALALALYAGRDAGVSRGVILRFVFRIALPVAILLGLPLALVARLLQLDVALWQALVAGLVIAMGWLTSAIFTEIGKTRDRAERLRDFHKAIYAEIATALQALWDNERGDRVMTETLERMRAEPDFVPYIPVERHDHVFDALVDRIEVLPRQTIDAIVFFYSQIKTVSRFAEDMRGERFRHEMSQDRRIAMYEDYTSMRREAFRLGQYALRLIRAYSEGGVPAADAEAARLNSPAADPSGR